VVRHQRLVTLHGDVVIMLAELLLRPPYTSLCSLLPTATIHDQMWQKCPPTRAPMSMPTIYSTKCLKGCKLTNSKKDDSMQSKVGNQTHHSLAKLKQHRQSNNQGLTWQKHA
jgi:hypothetical protein